MASIEHEHVMPFIGVVWDSVRDLCMVPKVVDGGDLRSLSKQFEEQRSRQQCLGADNIRIAMHVVHALAYLHSLKPVGMQVEGNPVEFRVKRQAHGLWTLMRIDRSVDDGARGHTAVDGAGGEKTGIFSFEILLSELDSRHMPYTKSYRSGCALASCR